MDKILSSDDFQSVDKIAHDKKIGVTIKSVIQGSKADKKRLTSGDIILKINKEYIMDVLDYDFHTKNQHLSIVFIREGKKHIVQIDKKEDEDLGIAFDSFLMDKENRCKNGCIFCFIDQMPKGLRDTLYFKDDDSRLSFLFGNYVTLTNLTEHEINRIIKMHISPINISVHTTNPELRCLMMKNRFAGQSLDILKRFAEGGIKMQCQLVLCPDINDGDELDRSISDLSKLLPNITSIAVVPVGVTKFRDGLYPLETYTKEKAARVVHQIEAAGKKALREHGTRTFYAADEFYLKAETPLPLDEHYGDYTQLENGVGMMTLTETQYNEALTEMAGYVPLGSRILIATGIAALDFMKKLVEKATDLWDNVNVDVLGIRNEFFGETITVSGLVTGGDIIKQVIAAGFVGNKDILLITKNMLRFEGDLFLDNVSVDDVSEQLRLKVVPLSNDGRDILEGLFL